MGCKLSQSQVFFFNPYGLTFSQIWLLVFIKHYILYSIRANAHIPEHVYFGDEHLSSVSLMLGQIPAKRERHLCSFIMHCLYSRSSVVSSLYKMQSYGIRCRKLCSLLPKTSGIKWQTVAIVHHSLHREWLTYRLGQSGALGQTLTSAC